MTAVNDCSHRHVPGFPPRHQEGAAKCQARRLRHHAQRVVGRSWRAGACQVCHSTALFHVPALNVTHAAGASFNWPSPSPSSIRSGAFPSRALPHDPCSSTRSPPNSESSQRLRSFQRLGLQCPVGVLLYPCLPVLQLRSCRDAPTGTVHLDAARLSLRKPLLTRAVGRPRSLISRVIAAAGTNFISVKGPELLNKFVGESERAIRTPALGPCWTCFHRRISVLFPQQALSSRARVAANRASCSLTSWIRCARRGAATAPTPTAKGFALPSEHDAIPVLFSNPGGESASDGDGRAG